MAVEGQKVFSTEKFGGICSVNPVGDSPPGTSPYCQNVKFYPTGVGSRDGFITYLTDPEGTVVYFRDFIVPDGTKYRLFFYSTGAIKIENPEGTLTVLVAGSTSTAGTFAAATHPKAATLFGKAFIALGDGSKGTELPRQYSPTLAALLPVAPDGPGKAPALNGAYPTACAATDNGFVMVTPTAVAPIVDGSVINFVVCFKTSTGFITPPSPPLAMGVSADGTYVVKLDIPTGPSYVTERLIFCTPSTGGTDYFHIPGGGMQVKDNSTTTTAEFGYTDSVILSGVRLADVVGRALPPAAGFVTYNQRLVSWGSLSALSPILSSKTSSTGRSVAASGTHLTTASTASLFGAGYMQGPINWRFEGGSTGGVPNGWTNAVAGAAITTSATAVADCWRWTGTGVAADTGALVSGTTSVTTVDGVQSPFLAGLTYRYRLRLRRSSGATGTLRVTGGSNFDIDIASSVGTDWTLVSGGSAIQNPTLSVLAAAPLPVGEWVELDWIEAYQDGSPYERSILRVSRPGEPEAFSDDTGLIAVSPDDGQEIRSVFSLRGNLYIAKERSLYYTTDTGDTPVNWPVSVVSDCIGTESARGVAVGDGFIFVANRTGVYMFQGGIPTKLSEEIEDLWRRNQFSASGWIVNDPERRTLFARNNNYIYVLNYWDGMESGVYSEGRGRKWTVWTLNPTNSQSPVHGDITVRDSDVLDLLVSKQTTSSNDIGNSTSGTFDVIGAFPYAAAADPWMLGEIGSLPTAVTAGISDPLGGTLAYRWAEDASPEHRRLICGSNYVSATHARASIWLKNTTSATFTVTLGIRYYAGSTRLASFTTLVSGPYTVTGDWQRFSISTLGNTPLTGYCVLYLSIPANVTYNVFGPQLQTGGYDHGYVKTTTAPVASSASSLIQVLTRDQAYQADSDGYITSYYVGSPVGEPSGRSAFNFLTLKCWGAGTLTTTLFKIWPYGSVALANKTLVATPLEDLEIKVGGSATGVTGHFQQANWQVRVDQDPVAKWNLSQFSAFYTPSTSQPNREII